MANTKKQTEQNNEKKKCALYGRVSTDRQARIQDGGLDTQFDLMRKYIEYELSLIHISEPTRPY